MQTVDQILGEMISAAHTQRTAALTLRRDLTGYSYYITPAVGAMLLRLGAHHPAFMQALQGHSNAIVRIAIASPRHDMIGMLLNVPVRIRPRVHDGHLLLWPDDVIRAMDSGRVPWPVPPVPAERLN